MRKRVPQDYSQVGGGDFVLGYNNMLQYSKAVASTHPNADAIVATSNKRQLDATETVTMQLALGLSDTARYIFDGA